jgi:hypothetical protein
MTGRPLPEAQTKLRLATFKVTQEGFPTRRRAKRTPAASLERVLKIPMCLDLLGSMGNLTSPRMRVAVEVLAAKWALLVEALWAEVALLARMAQASMVGSRTYATTLALWMSPAIVPSKVAFSEPNYNPVPISGRLPVLARTSSNLSFVAPASGNH